MDPLRHIERTLRATQPATVDPGARRRTAVAMLLREQPAGPEMLFVERASHPNDPWSGDLGFPGA